MPGALPISPSQYWQGSDGPWSTFQIHVGTPPKPVYLLPTTSQSTIWTVLSAGCTAQDGLAVVPDDCAELRGQLFDPTNSSSFSYDGHEASYNNNEYFALPFLTEAAINASFPTYQRNALVGADTIILADNGPSWNNQTLACFAVPDPLLGQLGLKQQNTTIASRTDEHQSLLGYLNSSGAVSSATFGYTAGSQGQNTYGSLTLGGYDAARLQADQVISQRMSAPTYRDLQITVSDIQIGSTQVPGLPSDAAFLIDSMVPDIWLPGEVCDYIASAYGLTYNTTYGRYVLSTTQHDNLTSLSESMTSLSFTLRPLGQYASSMTQITIPYVDLDHRLEYPETGMAIGEPSVFYFPIRRANNSEQYYLGRTFLQDAYLGVDYDHQMFNISPAAFPSPNTLTDIREIVNHGPATTKKSSGLSGGAIAGIVIGAAAAVALIAGLVFFYLRKRKRDRLRFSAAPTLRPMSFDGTTINDPKPNVEPEQPTPEYYNKAPVEMNGEEQDQFKPELEGSFAAHERHELYGSSIRRRSDQSRASVSPLPRGESLRGRMGHLRQYSDSSFGQPSPASVAASPPLGPESPPLEMEGGTFVGPFELHGRSRDHEREATSNSAPATVAETVRSGEGEASGPHD